MRIATIFLTTTLFTGCVIGDDPAPNESDDEILGGVTDSGDPAVGMLRVVMRLDAYGNPAQVGMCTATLIAPRIMVTAAHCVGRGFSSVSFSATPNFVAPLASSEWIPAQVFANPLYNGNVLAGHDVAVITLASAVAATPKKLGATPAAGAQVRAVGYGMDTFGNNGAGAGTKRTVMMPVLGVTAQEIVAGTDGVGTCHGDSGGPIFSGDTIIATTSYGDDATCHNSGHYMRLDDNLPFIHKYAPFF